MQRFWFATTNNEDNANLLIQKLNGFEFNGSKLRVELSEKKESNSKKKSSGKLNNQKKRKDFKKIVHSDAPNLEAPDPRWAGELSKLKDLLANQKTPAQLFNSRNYKRYWNLKSFYRIFYKSPVIKHIII